MQFKETWSIISPLTAAISAILVTQTAGRSIQVSERQRQEDKTLQRVAKLHYLITLSKCLEARLDYMLNILTDDTERPLIALTMAIADSTVHYEKLFDKDNFVILQGEMIDALIGMAGTIFGANLLRESTMSTSNSKAQIVVPKYSTSNPMIEDLQSAVDTMRRIGVDLQALRAGI